TASFESFSKWPISSEVTNSSLVIFNLDQKNSLLKPSACFSFRPSNFFQLFNCCSMDFYSSMDQFENIRQFFYCFFVCCCFLVLFKFFAHFLFYFHHIFFLRKNSSRKLFVCFLDYLWN